jgi:hypothetical protein
LATGSALTFDGTKLSLGATSAINNLLTIAAPSTVYTPQLGFQHTTNSQAEAFIGSGSNAHNIWITAGAEPTGDPDGSNWATARSTVAAIYRQRAANHIWFSNSSLTAGSTYTPTEIMRLTSTGLGIGTSSPAYKLDVSDQARISAAGGSAQLRLERTGSGAGASWIGADSDNLFVVFNTSFSSKLTLNSSGNLGLGVTPAAWRTNGGDRALQVGPRNSLFSDTGLSAELGNNVCLGASGFIYVATATASRYRQYQGAHEWFSAASGTAGDAISFTQRMTLDTDGNLLVGGTTSPSGKAGNFVNLTASGGFWTKSGGVSYFGTLDNYAMVFATNDTERARIDSSGNLGIGTSSPASKLEVNGGDARFVNTNGRVFIQNGNTSGGAKIAVRGTTDTADGYLAFETYSIEFGRFDSSGRLGIGTSSPSRNLQVVKSTAQTDIDSSTQVLLLENTATDTSGNLTGIRFRQTNGTNAGQTFIGMSSTGDSATRARLVFAPPNTSGNSTERMTIMSNGNVGIGTSSPTIKFQTVQTIGDWTGDFKNYTAGAYGLRVDLSGSSGTNAALQVYTATGQGMIVRNDGIVGIGTFTPDTSTLLTVAGAVTITGQNSGHGASRLKLGQDSSAVSQIRFYGADNSTAGILQFTGSSADGNVGGERARISSTGGFSVGTTADPGAGAIYATGDITTSYSDARLKNVSGKIKNALDKVLKLSGVYYKNNDLAKSFGYASSEPQVGVLAGEVEAVLPEVVKAAPFDIDQDGNSKSRENYKTVQYERLVPLLIEAIKEQQAVVAQLQARIDAAGL